MKKSRLTEEQIVFALRQAELGTPVPEVCRKLGISDATFYIYGLPSVLQVLNLVLGCCLHLSGIRKICAQMGNSHTIASTTGRPLRPV